MARKLIVLFLLSFLVTALLATSVFGADQAWKRLQERTAIPVKHAPVYGFAGTETGQFATKGGTSAALGIVSTNAVGNEIGTTAYDYQHNGTMGHQIEHRGTSFIHFDWMDQPDFIIPGDRGTQVQSYDLTGCSFSFDPGGKRASVDYSGYVNIDADVGGCAIPVAHEGDPLEPRAFWDFCAGAPVGLFSSDAPSDIYGYYQTSGTGPGNENIWPVVDWQIGTQNVLHFVCCETGGAAGDPQTISYYRRVGAYGTGAGTWSAQRVIDTVMTINPVVASSSVSDKVCVVWGPPTDEIRDTPGEFDSQFQNDVWYASATDQGAAWVTGQANGSIAHEVDLGSVTGGNVTQFPLNSSYNFYTDLAALVDTDDNLHIVLACREWNVTDTDTLLFRRNSIIYHWSENVPQLRQVAKADWDTGGSCFTYAWNSDLAKISISECDDKLYVLYSQMGNAEQPCFDKSDENYMNAELYISASPDGGQNWDRGQNLTNSETPGCAAGDCESDFWASMARYGRTQSGNCPDEGLVDGQQYLDILYINDRHAGGIAQEEGTWTTSPVMWLSTPCRDVVVEPLYSDDAGTGYGECYSDEVLWVVPSGSDTRTLTMTNQGLQDNNYSISYNYTAPYSNWISLTSGTAVGVINSGGGQVVVEFTLTDPGVAPTPGTAFGEIQVDHDAVGSPRIIPVCLLVADDFQFSENTILSTTCKDLRVYNNGQLSNNASGQAMDYNIDCDTFNPQTTSAIYLYDGGPYLGWVDSGDTLKFTNYSTTFFDATGLRPLTPFTIDNSNSAYSKVSSQLATADTSLGLTVTYYVPTAEEDCDFVLVCQEVYNLSGSTISGVAFGEFIDWDVPSDSGSNNGANFDLARKMIWQFGGEYNQDDSTEAFCPQESDDRTGGMIIMDTVDVTMPKSAQTVDNPTWVYTTGPFGGEAPLAAGPMYAKMVTDEGFATWSSTAPESLYTDISMLVTFGVYDIGVNDTVRVYKTLFTTKDALVAQDMYDAAWAFFDCAINDNCGGGCCDTPGDANNDGGVNVGDGVYIINFVFKGGPAPVCPQEGDANADGGINVGDGVYIINFVFKGGPAPVCGP